MIKYFILFIYMACIGLAAAHPPRSQAACLALALIYGVGVFFMIYVIILSWKPKDPRTLIIHEAESLMQSYISHPSPSTWEASWEFITIHKIKQGEVDRALYVRWLDVSRNPHLGDDPAIGIEDRNEGADMVEDRRP